jgi:hypothetical protein
MRRVSFLLLVAAALPVAWASHASAAPQSRESFPAFHKGDGTLGYGKPDRVITDVTAWKHPTKTALATLNEAKVVRVEFYKAGSYPVFFVQRVKDSTTYRYLQLHETATMDRWAARILKANADWAFEVVDQTDRGFDRFRTNAKRFRGRTDRFEGPGDEDGFLEP